MDNNKLLTDYRIAREAIQRLEPMVIEEIVDVWRSFCWGFEHPFFRHRIKEWLQEYDASSIVIAIKFAEKSIVAFNKELAAATPKAELAFRRANDEIEDNLRRIGKNWFKPEPCVIAAMCPKSQALKMGSIQ